jgi:hypothetical protein
VSQTTQLLARKLAIAFIVGFGGIFLPAVLDVLDAVAKGDPANFSTTLIWSTVAGAFAAGIRAVLALSPLNLTPSDALHTIRIARAAPPDHPMLAHRGSFAELPLGRLPTKHDSRTLQLAKYLKAVALPKAPATFDVSKLVAVWPMYGNDRLGDCTCAAVGHMIEAWTAAARVLKTVTDAAVERMYWRTGQPPHNAGQPGSATDTGRYELDVLNYWRKTGVASDHLYAFAAVKPSDHSTVKTAAWLFGGLYIGIGLPLTAQTQSVWDVVGDGKTGRSAPWSWGGHAVNVVAYDDQGLLVVTWGGLMRMTWRFWDAYVEEPYALISKDWLNRSGKTLAGFDLAALDADLRQVTA